MHLKYNVRPNEAIGQSVTWVHKFLTTGFTIVSQMSFRYLGEALFFDLAETIILRSHTHTHTYIWVDSPKRTQDHNKLKVLSQASTFKDPDD